MVKDLLALDRRVEESHWWRDHAVTDEDRLEGDEAEGRPLKRSCNKWRTMIVSSLPSLSLQMNNKQTI